MHEIFVAGETLPEAYHASLLALRDNHDVTDCPDYGTRQMEASATFVVRRADAEPMISRLFVGDPRSLEQYRQELLDGILDFEVDRGNWEYTYHRRMERQLPWVLSELRRNPDTRRAIISVRDEDDLESGSPACLQSAHFLIRGNALHCKVLFRSNDATKAAFMNAFALICLQKRFADELGIATGSYTHRANSYHVYERDWEMFSGYVRALERGEEVTYPYVGGWDEMMDDAKPEIEKMVRRQREKT